MNDDPSLESVEGFSERLAGSRRGVWWGTGVEGGWTNVVAMHISRIATTHSSARACGKADQAGTMHVCRHIAVESNALASQAVMVSDMENKCLPWRVGA